MTPKIKFGICLGEHCVFKVFFILFLIYTIVLLIIGTPNALVIAFLCSLLNLIPFIGPFFAGILMILLTMSSYIGYDFSSVILPKATYVAIGLSLIHI